LCAAKQWQAVQSRLLATAPPAPAAEIFREDGELAENCFHLTVGYGAPLELVEGMLKLSKQDSEGRNLCAIPNNIDWLPLHYAALHGRNLSIAKLIIRENPLALFVTCLDRERSVIDGSWIDVKLTPAEVAAHYSNNIAMTALLRKCAQSVDEKDYAHVARCVRGDGAAIEKLCSLDE
jgi:hypothetical protein